MKKINPVLLSDIDYARNIRNMRSIIKSEIKTGKTTIEKILSDKDFYEKYVANMKLIDLVSSLPGYGKKSGEKILARLKISNCKSIKGLGTKQYSSFIQYFDIKL